MTTDTQLDTRLDPQADPQPETSPSTERQDLLESLRRHRFFLTVTARGLTDEQAGLRSTTSELCIGGIVKHVTVCERNWVDFILGGAEGMRRGNNDWDPEEWAAGLRMLPGDTLEQVLAAYAEVARRTDEVVATVDLDASHPLPPAPWFEPGAHRSARRVFLHIIAETAQHAGHADILRETIDGQKSMG